jgi:DNA-binding NarL/FixJ family response regulator
VRRRAAPAAAAAVDRAHAEHERQAAPEHDAGGERQRGEHPRGTGRLGSARQHAAEQRGQHGADADGDRVRAGAAVVAAAEASKPDVAVLDIRMPQRDGIEATRRIAAALGDDTRVLMLTTFGLDDYVFDALRAGASGFMLKDAPPEELLEAIRVVAGGSALLAPAITRSVIAEFVLVLLTRGRSNAEIAGDLVVSEATVKTHVAHVLMKLGVRDRVQAVIFAYEAGLVSPGAA